MALREQARSVTVDEYFALLEKSDVKLEFSGGRLMTRHGALHIQFMLQGQSAAILHNQLEASNCRVYGNSLVVKAGDADYFFPSCSITCGEGEVESWGDIDALLNPNVIVEVLSLPLQMRDRIEMFEDYQNVTSLQHYVLIARIALILSATPVQTKIGSTPSPFKWIARSDSMPLGANWNWYESIAR